MYIITIKTGSIEDVDAIKEALENAQEENQISEPFELEVQET